MGKNPKKTPTSAEEPIILEHQPDVETIADKRAPSFKTQMKHFGSIFLAAVFGGACVLLCSFLWLACYGLPGPSLPKKQQDFLSQSQKLWEDKWQKAQIAQQKVQQIWQEKIDAIEQEIANLKQQRSLKGKSDEKTIKALEEDFTHLHNQLTSLQQDSQQIKTKQDALMAMSDQWQQKQQEVQQAVQETQKVLQIKQMLSQKLQEFDHQVNQGKRLGLLYAFRQKVESGAPYSDALRLLHNSFDKLPIDAFSPFAEKGLVTPSNLAEEVSDFVDKISFQTLGEEKKNAIWSRFMHVLHNFVVIRRQGDIQGHSAEAIAAQLEEAVKFRRYAEALTLWGALPLAKRQPFSSLSAHLKAYAELEGLFGKISLLESDKLANSSKGSGQIKPDTASPLKPDATGQIKPDTAAPVKPDATGQIMPDTASPAK